MERNLKIIGLFLIVTLLGLCFSYSFGYSKGYIGRGRDDQGQWLTGPEGFCLADKPPHPGYCKGEGPNYE